MRIFLRLLFLFITLFIALNTLEASHIMGGEITWECQSNGQYIIRFSVYRDCSGANLSPEGRGDLRIHNYPSVGQMRLICENACGGSNISGQWGNTGISQAIEPNCRPGSPNPAPNCGNGDPEAIFEYVRETVPITLTGTPPPAGWIITYDDNARNATDNLPASGFTLRAKIFNHAGTVAGQCVDDSPVFREKPTSLICNNQAFTYNHNATDVELDSLVYEWAQPLNQIGNTQVFVEGVTPPNLTFLGGYSFNDPFPGPETLNGATGEISLNPNAAGKYVSVIKVTAWKCGEAVAEINRELQSVISNSCNVNQTKPIINPPFQDGMGNFTLWDDTVRAGDLVTFNIQASDFASLNPPFLGDSVTLTATGLQFGTNFTSTTGCDNPPCAALGMPLPQSDLLGVTNTFSWQTDCNHVSFTDRCISGQNTYTFVVTAIDDECPIPIQNIATISITVVGDTVIDSPTLNCVDVQSNGDVTLDWDLTPNINNSFTGWMIYSGLSENGPFTLIDSVLTYSTSTYTHVGAGADTQQRWYHVRSRSGCKGIVTNIARDTVSTIFVSAVTDPTVVNVNWTALSDPNPTGSATQYNVFREYPIGSGFSLHQTTSNLTIAENFTPCEDSVTYRVELVNATKSCTSTSNIFGYRFKFPDPQTNFSIPTNACPGQTVSFTNLTTITGGTISYLWDFGDASPTSTATSPTHSYAAIGTYTVTLTATSGKGCDSVFTQQIQITLPTADAGSDGAICPGGMLTIGGSPTTTAGNTVVWSPSTGLSSTTAFNPTANPSSTTTYTVTVTDINGCTNTDDVVVTVNSIPTADAGLDQTICSGNSATIGGSPTGPGGSTFSWSPTTGLSSATIANPTASPATTTTYTVTVTSGVNCSATDQITVTVNPLPNIDAGPDQTICNGGSVLIGGSPTSSTSGATYSWSNGASLSSTTIANPTASPTVTTDYRVTVTHPNGCSTTDLMTVTVNALPSIGAGPDRAICLGSSTQLGSSPTGPAGSTFLWDNGASLSSTTASNPTATPTVTTTYSLTVTDLNGCTNTDQVVVTVNTLPTADAGTDQTICEGVSVGIGGSPTGPVGATYSWSPTTGLSSSTTANPTANPTTTTTYTVTVTDGNGCTDTDDILVTILPLPDADAGADQVICDGNSVTIGGSPTSSSAGATFLWGPATGLSSTSVANPSANPTATTTYTVTVTATNGCTATDQVLVTVNSNPTADAGVDQTICDGNSATIGGSPTGPAGSTFLWSPTTGLSSSTVANPTANPTTTTTYTVTVTSGVSCTTTDQVTITVDPLPNIDAGPDQTICTGASVTIGGSPTSSTAGATFSWSNGASLSSTTIANPIASPTVTTDYRVTVTHPNGCSSTDLMNVTVNSLPITDAGADRAICIGGNTQLGGSPTGPAGSTYVWDNGTSLSSTTTSNPIATPTVTTTYNVTVTDINGCTDTDDVVVTINSLPTVDAGTDQTICETSSATLGGSPTGPAGATFLWNNAGTLNDATAANPIATPLSTTTYTVTVTDGAGCTDTDDVTITVDPIPSANAGPDRIICDGIPVQIGGTPTSTTAGATYAWDNAASLSNATVSNPTANPSITTTYTVTVTHPNGCTNTDDVIVTVNANPTADAGIDQTICLGNTATLGGSPTGPGGSTFLWDNAGTLDDATLANPTATPTTTTTYTVTVTSGLSCTSTDQVTITVNPVPDADAGPDQSICIGGSVVIGGTPTSNVVGATFAWDNGASLNDPTIANPIATAATTTTYTVTVTHTNGCTNTDQMTVTVNSLPTVDAGPDQTICIGSNVQIGGSPTGPAGATYNWDNAASLSSNSVSNPIATPTVTTTYSVTVTDVNGCTDVDQATVTVNSLPIVDAGLDRTICETSSTMLGGSPTGPGGSVYQWNNAGTLNDASLANPTATPLSTTTYTVTVTDGNGCSETDDVTVTVDPIPSADAGADRVICIIGSVQIGGTPTSTTAGATFAWDNVASLDNATIANPTANPTVTTTYTVTVTHPNGCTNTDDVVVTVNALPIVDAGSDQTICIGGSATIGGSPTGPAGSSYNWDNAGTLSSNTIANPSATPVATTTYTVTVTDINGCTNTDQVTITVNPLPNVDAGPNITICEGSSTVIGGSPTSSTAGATFAWDNGGTLTSTTDPNPTANPIVTTIYTVTVTHPNGCTLTDDMTVIVNPAPVTDAGSDQALCIGGSVTLGGSPTGPAGSTYNWDNATTLSIATASNPTATPTVTTTYTVTVTDINGCTNTDQTTITVNPLPIVDAGGDQIICELQSATLGGSPTGPAGSAFSWDNAGSLNNATDANPIATPAATTTYTVTVTDVNGCTDTDQITITVNPNPDADAGTDQTICNMQAVVIGGSPTSSIVGATFAWDNATSLNDPTIANPTAMPATTTTYTVTVTHTNGCTNTDQVTVTVNSLPTVDAGSDQSLCIGGSVSIGGSPTGPTGSTYQWDNTASLSSGTVANPTATPTVTTTYSVTVTDVNGCTGTDQTTVTVNPLPDADAGPDQTICNLQSVSIGGSPTSTVVGATFAWDNVGSLNNATDANPIANPSTTTTYTVTVTDANGCTETDDVTITVNPLPTADAGADQSLCIGGSVNIGGSPTGPAGATYAWDNGISLSSSSVANPTATPTVTTTYTVTVTDGNGCTDTDDVTITVNPLPIVDAGNDQTICEMETATLGGSPTGPAGSTYNWDNAGSLNNATDPNPIASPTATTTYTVTVTDVNGCIATDQITITVNPIPDADAGADQTICNLQSVVIGGSPTSSVVGATFAWDNAGSLSNASIANPTATPATTTTYTVTVTHPNGCTNTDDIVVTVNQLPVADAGADQPICIGGSATLGGSPTGPAGSTFLWDNATSLSSATAANPTATPTVSTTYSVTVTDGNGCTNTDAITITVNPLPDADAGTDQTICNTQSATLGGSPTSTAAGATFLWDNATSLNNATDANPIATPSITTTYTVTVTDGNGCTQTDAVTIFVNPLPIVDFAANRVCLNEATSFTDQSQIFLPSMLQNWLWDFGDGVGTSTQQNPQYTYTTAGTYTVKLIVTSNFGCIDSMMKNIVVDTLPTADAGLDRSICEFDTTILGTAPIIGESYQWDNAATLSSTTVAQPAAFPTVNTTYSVTVTNTNGCSSIDQVNITVDPAPNVDAGGDLTICQGDTITIGGSPTSSTANVTYLWNNASSLDFDTLANPRAFPTDTTDYIVVVTDANGCSHTDTMTVNVNPLPRVDFQVDAICEGDFAAFTDLTTIPAGSISTRLWDFGDGVGTSTLQNPGYQYAGPGTYDVTLVVTSALGCIDSTTKSITILPLPIADAGGDRSICFGDTIQLGGTPTSNFGSTFSWTPSFDLSSVVDSNPMAYPLSTTTYYLSVTGANGCINFDTATITVNPLPNVTAEQDSTLCADQPVQLTAMGALTYSWSPTNWLDDPNIANPVARALKDVDYVVSGVDANGCIDRDTVTISVFNIDFTPQDTSVCIGDSVELVALVQGDTTGISYSWSPSGGLSSTTILNPKASPVTDQEYVLQITNAAGCMDRDSLNVTVFDQLMVDFTFVNSPRCTGAVLEIQNTSVAATNFQWYLNGQFVGDGMDPEFYIDNTVDNELKLIGWNATCTDSIIQQIPAAELMTLLQLKDANVFTPNGDGINDLFDPGFVGEFVGCVQFRIYDRWGKKVFDSDIGQYGWDGRTLRGRNAPVGMYYYIINIATEEIRGSIYLNR